MVEFSPAIYVSTAGHYDTHRRADSTIVDSLIKHLGEPSTGPFLDIGCGTGNYTTALAERGVEIEGVDLSASMLREARQKAPQMNWHEGDMRNLPFPANTYAGAITMNTLHYIRSALVESFMEMKRLLQPNGRLVIFALTLEQCLQFWVGRYFPFFWEVGRKLLPTREEIFVALQKAGFHLVDSESYFVSENSQDLFSYACKYRPHLFLDPIVRKGMTPFQQPEYQQEVVAGCHVLKAAIESGEIDQVITDHESSLGEGLFITVCKNL